MAVNLCEKLPPDTKLFIYDVAQAPLDRLKEAYESRIHICSSPKEVGENATCIITMLPESSHVEKVYLDPENGLFACSKLFDAKEDLLLIDSSTISPRTCLQVRDALLKQSSSYHKNQVSTTFVDAPVSGGVLGAEKGTLTFMVGCSPTSQSFASIRSILSLMGSSIIPCGGPSLGLVAKLCNNYCSSLIAVATSEAFQIGMAAGIDPRILQRVFNKSIAGSTVNEKWNPVPGLCPDAPSSKGYNGGFRVELMRKDIGLALNMGEDALAFATNVSTDKSMRLGREGLKIYEETCQQDDCKAKDSRVVYRWLGGNENWKAGFSEDLPAEYEGM